MMGHQMAALLQQRSRGAFGIARRIELAAFQAVERTVRGKEAVTALVPRNDARGSVLDFDDVGLGHVCSFTGWSGVPV